MPKRKSRKKVTCRLVSALKAKNSAFFFLKKKKLTFVGWEKGIPRSEIFDLSIKPKYKKLIFVLPSLPISITGGKGGRSQLLKK